MSGSGKTQFVKQMLASAMRSCDDTTGIIFIDFAKGDVADDKKFVDAIGARVVRMPGEILPVGPFHLPEYSPDAVRLASEEKREVYTQLFRNLGPKQQGRLAEAIHASYNELQKQPDPAPDFDYVREKLEEIYEHEDLQPDSLTELLRQLTVYRLFWARDSKTPPVSPVHQQRWVVDIHELGGLKEVTAFTLIEQLYREMRSLPEAATDPETGFRHIRCVVAIDEAQYYLRAKNRFLQGIVREGRSKGFAVMLMCQSPDDFDQDDFDYTEQLQFTYMLQCKTEPKAVQRLLGVSREEAKRLATDLGRMEPLSGIGVLPGEGRGRVSRFRLVPFFEMNDL
jgi:DNA helicase HerA-like ATPase